MRAIIGLICLTMVLAIADEGHARKRKKRRRARRQPAASRLLQASTNAPLTPVSRPMPAAPATRVKAEVAPRVEHNHFLVGTLLLQNDVRYSPSSVGFGLGYQLRLSESWRFSTGAAVGLRSNRTSVEPHLGFDVTLATLGPVELRTFGGVSAPIQLMADTTSIAVAGRVELGVGWQAVDWLSPQVGVLAIAGPLITPANHRWRPYVAIQVAVGARFGL